MPAITFPGKKGSEASKPMHQFAFSPKGNRQPGTFRTTEVGFFILANVTTTGVLASVLFIVDGRDLRTINTFVNRN